VFQQLALPTPRSIPMDCARVLSSPAFSCDARPFGCNRVGNFPGEVSHHLPTDGRIRIEQSFEVGLPGLRNLGIAFACYSKWVYVFSRVLNSVPHWLLFGRREDKLLSRRRVRRAAARANVGQHHQPIWRIRPRIIVL
jgi:hypothetical protein